VSDAVVTPVPAAPVEDDCKPLRAGESVLFIDR
jgi:hypothetical protein